MIMTVKRKIALKIYIIFLILLQQISIITANINHIRTEEIPFKLNENNYRTFKNGDINNYQQIHALNNLEKSRNFFHLFNVPYIVCFFAAKGKWPFVPMFIQSKVDEAAKTIFSHNDSYIKDFCKKWIQIKECFRPIFVQTTAGTDLEALRATTCSCASSSSVVYFDKNYIGNVSSETILNTIEFLQSFLPPVTRKPPRRNKIKARDRLDEFDID